MIPTPNQDPQQDNFLARLSTKNEASDLHQATVDAYSNYWKDSTALDGNESAVKDRRDNSGLLTNHYYDLVTDFYEYGWGTSFHFARMFRSSSFAQNIARHEDFLALKLGLSSGMKCLDVGCGVGGPLREIARFSGAHVTGLNNNAYQVQRCHYLAQKAGLASLTDAIKGDFESMPVPDESFDAAYSIEACCHARALENPYAEIFRVLKPGACFACTSFLMIAYEWLTTEHYDETNLDQKKIVHGIEEGDSISKLYSIAQCLDALTSVGFEIIESQDMADLGVNLDEEPWYKPLKGSYALPRSVDDLYTWRMNGLGRMVTDTMVSVLERVGLAPPGTKKISELLIKAADNLVLGGEQNLFTPMFFFVVRKPSA